MHSHLTLTLKEWNDLIQCPIIDIAIELWQYEHILRLERCFLFVEVDVDDILNWSA